MQQKTARRGIQSVEVAYRVLHALQDAGPGSPLKDVAAGSGLTPSAANNYLVSLVRTGLAAAADKPGTYKLGPSALTLGMSAIRQIDSFEIMRKEVTALRDETRHSAAVTTWTDDGALSLFTQDGDQRGAFEMRTGLIPMISTAAGRVFIGSLPLPLTQRFIEREMKELGTKGGDAARLRETLLRELKQKHYATFKRGDMSGYASIAAPIFDFQRQVRFTLSLVATRNALQTEPSSSNVKTLLDAAARATLAVGGTTP